MAKSSLADNARDFVNTKGVDIALTALLDSEIPGGSEVIRQIKKVGVEFDKIDEILEKNLIIERLRNNATFEKARNAFAGLPGSIVLIIFISIFILTLILLNIIGGIYGWTGYTKNIKYGIKNYDELQVQEGEKVGNVIEGDKELNVASVISLIIGIIGIIYAIVLVGVFIARFILKPKIKSKVESSVEGIDAILGSRTVEILFLIPCTILFLYFIAWTVINIISYSVTGSQIDQIKKKYATSTSKPIVLEQSERTKLQSSRQARFAIPSIASFIAGFYPIILSVVIIVYLIITRIRIKQTLGKVEELSQQTILKAAKGAIKAAGGAVKGAVSKK